ncbi:MAG: cryptochrome/photolyase family protein [Gammaproteobacteria bacterium]
MNRPRHLVVVLGDQLDPCSPALVDFDPQRDLLWMAELVDESRHVPSHKTRSALFLSAMRHFRDEQRATGRTVDYRALGEHPHDDLANALSDALAEHGPERLVVTQPGEWRILKIIEETARAAGVPLDIREDTHFLVSSSAFTSWLKGRKAPRMEHFYRWQRAETGILMNAGEPEGGRWNLDSENRHSFDARGPGMLPAPLGFEADATTRAAIEAVQDHLGGNPGGLERFDWPVSREQALAALADFISHRLSAFGPYQDALWTGEPWLYHSRLSAALNLKLLNPREVIDAALEAYRDKRAPLSSVEGFIRQILGWREYVRGLYWNRMPEFAEANALGADQDLPGFYWTGETDMRCLREAIGQTLEYGYAHHIQRLMITGLFALLYGVRPEAIHRWYLGVYVDAVEWVELPNTIGMSQYADGGFLASKPYVASGQYIKRMSNYCDRCPYDPAQATGERACPFTTLYWDFLVRHKDRFAKHPRTALMWRNLERKPDGFAGGVTTAARHLRERIAAGQPVRARQT